MNADTVGQHIRVFANREWIVARVVEVRMMYSIVEYYDHGLKSYRTARVRRDKVRTDGFAAIG